MSTPVAAEVVSPAATVPVVISPGRRTHPVRSFIAATIGWTWRVLAGAALCFNAIPGLSLFTSIIVFGWFYRWMQTVAVYGWWKRSRLRAEMTFTEFCKSLGSNGPAPRPRLFLQERIGHELTRPGPVGRPAGPLTLFGRFLRIPFHSLGRNFWLGIQGLLCTYLATGWGSLAMLFGWEFGWLNSFYKGYEQAPVGPVVVITGMFLFALAMIYVPMAQVHQAVSGQARAFFQFRVVYGLIRAKLGSYALLSVLTLLLALPLMGMRLAILSDDFPGNRAATEAEGLRLLQQHLYLSAIMLFLSLLLLRTCTAMIYRTALLKALRLGWITQMELAPNLALWLNRLDIMPIPLAGSTGILPVAGAVARFPFRFVVYAFIIAIWGLFLFRYLASYFFVADGYMGFINQPLIQFPCMDYVPAELLEAAR